MPYRATDRHNQFSACKALTALAAGLAIGDGKLSLDTKVVDLFGDKCPASPSDELRALTVRHLLTMTSGKAGRAQRCGSDRPARSPGGSLPTTR